jgi:hypothetical protein
MADARFELENGTGYGNRVRRPGAALPGFLRREPVVDDGRMFTGKPGSIMLSDAYRLPAEQMMEPAKQSLFKSAVQKQPAQPAAQAPPMYTDYANNGGDTRVTREAPLRSTPANIAGGVDRDELVRRMQNAGRYMVGSPSARAAMMGVYSDQLKALDEGALQDNKGNIENAQLGYQQNMEANRQEADGRRQFGNLAGLQERRFQNDLALQEASRAPVDAEMRALELQKLRNEVAIGASEAKQGAMKFDAGIGAEQDKGILERADRLYAGGKGGYATYDEALAASMAASTQSGVDPRSTELLRAQDNTLTDTVTSAIGRDSYARELLTKGFDGASFMRSTPLANAETYTLDDFELAPGDSWIDTVRRAVDSEAGSTLYPKGMDINSEDTPTMRLTPQNPAHKAIIDRLNNRKRGTIQRGQ